MEQAEDSFTGFLVQVHYNFGVRGRLEDVASTDQIFAELKEIVDFPVQYAGDVLVLVEHGLAACGQVDNAQPSVTKTDAIVEEYRALVGTALG
jgi:hypothetical protein